MNITTEYEKSLHFLRQSWISTKFQSIVSISQTLETPEKHPNEIFSSIIISFFLKNCLPYDFLCDIEPYVNQHIDSYIVHFFEDHTLLPADVDCTCFYLLTNFVKKDYVSKMTNMIARNVTSQNIIKVYFDNTLERKEIIDHVVCANVLYVLYKYQCSIDVSSTENYVYDILLNDMYLTGSRYYPDVIIYLWSIARLLEFDKYRDKFRDILCDKFKHVHKKDDPIFLSFYVVISKILKLDCTYEQNRLYVQKMSDGSWKQYALFKYGRQQKYFGSSSICTAIALYALLYRI
jgi:hypothetical protein